MNKIVLICCAVCVYIDIPICCVLLLHATNFLAHAKILTCAKNNLHVLNGFACARYFLHMQKDFAHVIKAACAGNFLHVQGAICMHVCR